MVGHQESSGIVTVSVDTVLENAPLMSAGPLLQQFAVRYVHTYMHLINEYIVLTYSVVV